MRAGDYIYTQRFFTVRVEHVFENEEDAVGHGFVENAYYAGENYSVYGKQLLGTHNMVFAAFKKNCFAQE